MAIIPRLWSTNFLKAFYTWVLSLATNEAEDQLKAPPAITWILEATSFGAETDPIDLIFFITDGIVLMYSFFRFLQLPCGCWKVPLSDYIFTVSEELLCLITAYVHNLPLPVSNFTFVRFKICSFKVFENDLLYWRFSLYTSNISLLLVSTFAQIFPFSLFM